MPRFIRVLVAILFFAVLVQTANSATFTVSQIADTNDGTCDADCSLREAVVAANASTEADTITFSSLFNTAQTITLGGTDIIITNNGGLTINGPGADKLTVSGNNLSRVFTNNTGAITTISNLRVTGGNGTSTVTSGRGGGIYNSGGTLTLQNVVITGNTAANGGAANNAGTATLNFVNCVLSNNMATGAGGALQNFAGNTTNIINSSIHNNTSNSTITGGGGIQANGTINISNTTFANNNAVGGSGGAIFYNGTVMNLNNVTIVGNTATNVTGGINKNTANPGNIRNTIISANTGGASPDFAGSANSQGNNIISAVGASAGWIGSDLQNVDPMLSAFANYGGLGNSFLPMPGSLAIDGGQNCVTDLSCASANPQSALTTDQRGVARPANGTVDIGAVEAANTSVGGRVLSDAGQGVPNTLVFMTSVNGNFSTRTNSFGNYRFNNIQVGIAVTVGVSSKAFTYTNQTVSVGGQITDLDFTPQVSFK